MVAATSSANPCTNTYRDGKITPRAGCSAGEKIRHIPGLGNHIPGADKAPATRNFVTGEKFWVTKITVKDTGKEPAVVMDLFTDAISDVRYKASLTIPFPRGRAHLQTTPEARTGSGDGGSLGGSEGRCEAGSVARRPGSRRRRGPQPNRQPPRRPRTLRKPRLRPSNRRLRRRQMTPPRRPRLRWGKRRKKSWPSLGQPQKKAKVGAKEILFL